MAEHLFNSRLRTLYRQRVIAALLLLATGPYAAAFLVMAGVPALESSAAGSALVGVAVLLSALLPWALYGRLTLLGNRQLEQALRRRLGPEAVGEFVGFSAGAETRSWEGETDQDIGLLTVEGNTLVYRGDQYSWSLRRQSIDRIQLQSLAGDQFPPVGPLRVTVYWHGPRDPGRAFTLASRAADTLTRANQATQELDERLRQWWEQGGLEVELTPLLGSPPTDTRAGVLLGDRPAPGSCLSAIAIAVMASSFVWYVAGDLVHGGQYNRAVLWAGLILMVAIVFTAHFLTYLQVHESGQQK